MTVPRSEELVVAYLLAFSGERFCVDCLARRTGVEPEQVRREIAALRSFPGARRRRRRHGRCSRCGGTTEVIGLDRRQRRTARAKPTAALEEGG